MHAVAIHQISDSVRGLFTADMPSGLRCFAMLNGDTCGRVLTDNLARPTWAAVQELAYDRTLYLGGALSKPVVHAVVEQARRDGDVVFCFWPNDARFAEWLPSHRTMTAKRLTLRIVRVNSRR